MMMITHHFVAAACVTATGTDVRYQIILKLRISKVACDI